MKKLSLVFLLMTMSLAACTTEVRIGDKSVPCVGLDNADRDPAYHYRVNGTNLVGALIFFETIFVPIYVAVDNLYCPDLEVDAPKAATTTN